MVAGSDRVKEYHDLLHKYNGVRTKDGHIPYHFKKISVVSAGHRDPDAEGAEGMSGTKMREHAKNNDFSSFRQGVPSHVADHHARELMKDVRKGMGLNEEIDRGMFKAIFVTGGPGSGKDIIIREAISEAKAVELNSIQAFEYLVDKQKLSEKSHDFRREAIRNRSPLIINGPADDAQRMIYVQEELKDMGYDTLMIFVNTSDEVSKERNEKLNRTITESVRHEKWIQAQNLKEAYAQNFDKFILFDNTGNLDTKEYDIHEIYQTTNLFFDVKVMNETASDWLLRNNKLDINHSVSLLFKEYKHVNKDSKSIQAQTTKRYNTSFLRAKGPADIKPDNSGSIVSGRDSIKGDTGPRKDIRGTSVTGGAWSGAYGESTSPTLKINPPAKEPNFQQDKDKTKRKKFGDKSLSAGRVGKPDGVGQTYDTRAGGQGAAAGAGLGNQTYSETQEYSNASQNGTAMLGAKLEPNPLAEKKPFNKLRKNIKEYNGFQNDTESGLGGVLGGASNKEGMDSYKDTNRNIGIQIITKKKKKKVGE
jgi:predicted kinase